MITIIVLLILAGMTLGVLLGPDGIINRAKESKLKTQEGAQLEQASLENLVREISNVTGQVDQVTDPNPGGLEVSQQDSNVLLINSIEDLVAFSNQVNQGVSYEGNTIKLNLSLDFESELSYVNPNNIDFGDINHDGSVEGLMKEMTTAEGFTPIGFSENNYFKGNFDGQNCVLYHIRMFVADKQYAGLFGYITGTVQNLKISNGQYHADYNTSNIYMGAIAGRQCH